MGFNQTTAGITRRKALKLAGAATVGLCAGTKLAYSSAGDRVLFGIGLSAPFVPFVAWVEKGIAADHGVNGAYQIFESGLGGVEAVVAGNGHVCLGSEANMARPRLSGASIVTVARCFYGLRDQGIGVGPDIHEPNDFRGRTVAVIRTTGADYLLSRYLEKHGLEEGDGPEQVRVVNVQPAEWIPAINSGDIDAFFGWEPWLSRLPEIVDGARVLAWASDDDLYHQYLYIAFREDWANANRDLAGATYRSLAAATDWTNENLDEAIELAAGIFRLEPETLAEQVAGVQYLFDTESWHRDRFKEMLGWAVEKGYMDIPDMDEFIEEAYDFSIAKDYAPERTDF